MIITAPEPALIRCHVRSEFKARAEGEQLIIEGYAALYDTPAPIGYWYDEIIRRGAFKDALDGKDDVRCLWQHDAACPLGRLAAGTLTIEDDGKGLIYRCRLGASQWARDAYDAIKRGDVNQSSFAFVPLEDKWTWAKGPDERDTCERMRVQLLDVSPVTYPAYDNTEVSARDQRHRSAAAAREKAVAEAVRRDAAIRAARIAQAAS